MTLSALSSEFEFPKSRLRRFSLLSLSVLIICAGVAHFTNPASFVAIMPPYLPAHLTLVYVSGVFEILGGIGAIFTRTRRLAGWGLIVLLVAVFPANVHMALHPGLFPDFPAWAYYVRLPLQFLFIVWVWWSTQPDSPEARLDEWPPDRPGH